VLAGTGGGEIVSHFFSQTLELSSKIVDGAPQQMNMWSGDEESGMPERTTEVKTIMDIERGSVFRGLVTMFVVCCLYTLLGILLYRVLLGWDLFDSTYFMVVALSTVGYGDLVPHTPKERLFTSFFLIIGFFMFGAFISMQVSAVAAHAELMARARNLRAARSINASTKSQAGFLMARLRRISRDVFRTISSTGRASSTGAASFAAAAAAAAGGLGTINEVEGDREQDGAAPVGADAADCDELMASSRLQPPASPSSGRASAAPSSDLGPTSASTTDMKAFLLASYDQDLIAVRTQAVLSLFIASIIVVVGMGVMMGVEHWTGITAFYWACQTITTVGFGDVVPKTAGGRSFAMVFILVGCGFLAKAVTDFVKYPLLLRERRHEKRLLDQFEVMTAAKLQSIFHSELFVNVPNLRRQDDELSKAEFVLLVLQLMGKLKEQDVLLVASLFDRLDASSAGALSQAVMAQRLQEAEARDAERARREEQARRDEEWLAGGGDGAFSHGHERSRRGSFLDAINSVIGAGLASPSHSQSPPLSLSQSQSQAQSQAQSQSAAVGNPLAPHADRIPPLMAPASASSSLQVSLLDHGHGHGHGHG